MFVRIVILLPRYFWSMIYDCNHPWTWKGLMMFPFPSLKLAILAEELAVQTELATLDWKVV